MDNSKALKNALPIGPGTPLLESILRECTGKLLTAVGWQIEKRWVSSQYLTAQGGLVTYGAAVSRAAQ